MIVITIQNSKNGSSRKFVVMEALWVQTILKYLKICSAIDMKKLFISIRNGKATRQHIGHNTIGQMPKRIAMYLKLENVQLYTGHSFRRTSATILASNGGNTLQLKQHGGWKSSTVAEGYIEDSLAVKKSIALMVQKPSATTSHVPNDVEIPSTSASYGPTIEETNTFTNTEINIPTTSSSTTSTLLNLASSGITMNCNNCVINYNFYK